MADDHGGTKIDLNDPEVQAVLQAELEKHTTGLKKNRDDLLLEKKKLQDEYQKYAALGEPDKLREIIERINNDETSKLLAEGKIDEVIAKRTEMMQRDYKTQIDSLSKKLEDYESQIKAKDQYMSSLVIDGQVKEAAIKQGIMASAIEDAVYRAKQIFSLDDNGQPIARDPQSGELLLGKDGRTPLTPMEWLSSMKDRAPHWWAQSTGGGAGGNRSGRATADLMKLPAVERLKIARRGGN